MRVLRDQNFVSHHFLIPFIFAAFIRCIPLFWSTEVFDVTLYRHQAIAILDHINPYLYEISPAFSTLKQPYVYLPFSIFYAPFCLWFSQITQIPFASAIKIIPVVSDLAIFTVLYAVLSQKSKEEAAKAAWVYALCPISILIVSFHGNIMAGPTLLTLVSYLFFEQDEHDLSALFLGLAIAWRTYPILLLPAFLLNVKDFRSALRFILFASMPVIVTTLPFLMISPEPMLKSLSYSGVNGVVGWHVLPTLASGSLFANSFLLKKLAAYLLQNAQHVDKIIFSIIYLSSLFWMKRRKDLLQSIIFIFLLIYFSLTTVAQQYFIWVLPFLFLWSRRAALVYSIIGGFALLVLYWAIYPEMLFGIFPIARLSVAAEYWLGFFSETGFWLVIGILMISVMRSNNTRRPIVFNEKFSSFSMKLAVYVLVSLLAVFESIYILNLDRSDSWDVVRRISVDAEQKKTTSGQILRSMPSPKAAVSGEGFVWFDPTDKSLQFMGKNGSLKSKIFLKNPKNGKILNIRDLKICPDGTLMVSEIESGFLAKFDATGNLVPSFDAKEMIAPSSIAVSHDGKMAVIDCGSNTVYLLNHTGAVQSRIPYNFRGGVKKSESFDIGMDNKGQIYVLDSVRRKVSVFSAEGNKLLEINVRIFEPQVRLTVGPQGSFSILNLKTTQISFYSNEGKYLGKMENEYGKDPKLGRPFQVLMDKEGKIFIADSWNFEILEAKFKDIHR